MTLSPSPPVAGVCWAHTLDWLYDSLSSPPVAGVCWAHTLDWLYDSLSSPPVAGVCWAHTLDWPYDSLSSPPVAGVCWAHTLDWLYDSLSSPPVAGVCWAHTLDWLYDSLSSPPVAGVWWVHWRHCPVQKFQNIQRHIFVLKTLTYLNQFVKIYIIIVIIQFYFIILFPKLKCDIYSNEIHLRIKCWNPAPLKANYHWFTNYRTKGAGSP